MMYTAVNSSSAVSTNAEKLSTLPWPYRWSASAGLSATRTERNVITAATRSRMECSASDKTPKLPVRTTRNTFSEISRTADPTEANAASRFSWDARSRASKAIGGLYAVRLPRRSGLRPAPTIRRRCDYFVERAQALNAATMALFCRRGGGVQDDAQRSDLRGLGVAVDEEALAVLGCVVGELIGG